MSCDCVVNEKLANNVPLRVISTDQVMYFVFLVGNVSLRLSYV